MFIGFDIDGGVYEGVGVGDVVEYCCVYVVDILFD